MHDYSTTLGVDATVRVATAIAVTAVLLTISSGKASALEYGDYDAARIVREVDAPSGRRFGLDAAYLDRMLTDLAAHATDKPPKFDSPQDLQRARRDAQKLSGMLDALINVPSPNVEFLMRAAHLNSMAHNLGVPGAGEKARTLFERWLQRAPDDARGHLLYGTFLARTGQYQQAQAHLEQARAAGMEEATYALGLVRLALGDRMSAFKFLDDYRRLKPTDPGINQLIEGVRNGTIDIRWTSR